MPFKRPTLTELREQNRQYLVSEMSGTGQLMRFSNMGVLADVDAGMAHLHFAYLDYIARQATPYTSTDEYLAAWAALKTVYRKSATAARTGRYRFKGAPDSRIPAGAILNRADGYQYQLDADVTTGTDGYGYGTITARLPDPASDVTGGGAGGNAPAGTSLTLDVSVAGVEVQGTVMEPLTGGADIEEEDLFRRRMLQSYQNPPEGGGDNDYIAWALAVSGVTRAWVKRRIMGPGTVGVYIMCDGNDRTNHGMPVGSDGISSLEEWSAVKATGDQGRVADAIFALQPATALVWVCAPEQMTVDFTFSGVSSVSKDTRDAMEQAIAGVIFENGSPDGKGLIMISDLQYALSSIPEAAGYVMQSPDQNIRNQPGKIPVVGKVAYV
ncbi:TPA: baseplate J/gp47 family protein [Klebsiella oxytoca]|uniref:Baseplate J/gp47 family protein n=1 Tax=Klebsiella oxytoca TaxID=571 RepID=A0AAN5LB87_KLEOX|nr:baseplate J/gp47 family protein [Klebsiella oxytoca]